MTKIRKERRIGMDQDTPSGAHPNGHPLRAPGLKWRGRVGGVKIPMWIPPAKDVRAGYMPKSLMLNKAASAIELAEKRRGAGWSNGWVWDGHIQLDGRMEWVGITSDWRLRYYQTKKGSNLREFNLNVVPRLLRLIQRTPEEARRGPIIICEETGEPWIKRRYQEKFREIARAAGVPDHIFSMDMRSGGATEADMLPEVTDRMFDDAGGWADPNMKHTYRRHKQRNAQKVVELRQAARTGRERK